MARCTDPKANPPGERNEETEVVGSRDLELLEIRETELDDCIKAY
jgi:hypothetical protein